MAHVPEPDRSDRLAYGKYLVTVGHCEGCHTPEDEHGNPIPRPHTLLIDTLLRIHHRNVITPVDERSGGQRPDD